MKKQEFKFKILDLFGFQAWRIDPEERPSFRDVRMALELLQSEFKTTPHLMEISSFNQETGYRMGVYLCLDIKSHEFNPNSDIVKQISDVGMGESTPLENMKMLWHHHDEKYEHGWVVFLGSSKHKIKKKAEQAACKMCIEKLS